jgi:PleD family two-component response regulator
MGNYLMAAVDDMFFASKIRATANALEIDVRYVKTPEAALEVARSEPPSLIIADLHSVKCDPLGLAERLKADEVLRTVPLLGFFSHVDGELRRRADSAGYDVVMPRSVFSSKLPEILRQYGL